MFNISFDKNRYLFLLFRSELSGVRSQLHEAEDRESERNVEIARLKADLNHWKNRATKLNKELQTSDEALKKANNQLQVRVMLCG